MSTQLAVVGLDRMGYDEALEIQRSLAQARIDGGLERDTLLLVEHPRVITLGRSGELMSLLQRQTTAAEPLMSPTKASPDGPWW